MPWSIFKDGKQVGKSYPTKIQAQTEANENGWILFSKDQLWMLEGYEFREFEEEVTPKVGDNTFSLDDGDGKITSIEENTVTISLFYNDVYYGHSLVYKDELKLNKRLGIWEYKDLEQK